MAGEMEQLAETQIGQAIHNGSAREVRDLIQAGEDVMAKDRKGNTYVHFVCTIYRPYVINVLLVAGVDVNAQNKDGNTALHVTALHRECCNVPTLMACYVNPLLKNKFGKTAKDIAKDNKYWLNLHKMCEPGLRRAIETHDLSKLEDLFHCWPALHLIVVDGKNARQFAAGLKFHDIVAMTDTVKFSNMAVYGVLEHDYKKLEYAISRRQECDVNFLRQNRGTHGRHILQDAIQLQDYKMVDMLVEAGADVNIRVHVKEYFRGPLFFEAIRSDPHFDLQITKRVLSPAADVNARDERGRTALIYAIDRRSGTATPDLIKHILMRGANISLRDDTGCTARNVARFARCRDVVQIIDNELIRLIRDSNLPALRQLAVQGYDDFFIHYGCRDSWIYAAGNDTDDVRTFLEYLPAYHNATTMLHDLIRCGDLDGVQKVVDNYPDTEMLLCYKDKGGRCSLLKAILYNQPDIVRLVLDQDTPLLQNAKDNTNRTALHYACALGKEDVAIKEDIAIKEDVTIKELLIQKGASTSEKDCTGLLPEDMLSSMPGFILKERKTKYGLDLELQCMEKYENLLSVIRSKHKHMKHFLQILKTLRYPLAKFPDLFSLDRHPLVTNYRDLLLAAIDNRREDIARKLVRLGLDWRRTEEYSLTDGRMVRMNAVDRANHLGLSCLADFIMSEGQAHTSTIKAYRNRSAHV
ncbi:hypothetical protein LSAT2_006944 [Lamellibrachia satsuma]|nr:hypothetical protein LSAT2_006944 [Lamellibrachia satsuma]